MKKPWTLNYPLSAQRRRWSDWADAQADLSLRWAHTHFVGFVTRRFNSFLRSSVFASGWVYSVSGQKSGDQCMIFACSLPKSVCLFIKMKLYYVLWNVKVLKTHDLSLISVFWTRNGLVSPPSQSTAIVKTIIDVVFSLSVYWLCIMKPAL